MAMRIPWDKYEIAILLDACVKVIENETTHTDATKKVSETLRQRAIKKGIEIDSVFRNENGITMQMTIMMALIQERPLGLHASKLFIDMVQLFKQNPMGFNKILKKAKEHETIMASIKERFYGWLDIFVHSADIPSIKGLCNLVDSYSRTNKELGYSIYEIEQPLEIYQLIDFLEKDVFFKAKNGRQMHKIKKALEEYYRFLKTDYTPLGETMTTSIIERKSSLVREDFLDVEFDRYKEFLAKNYSKGFRLNDKLSLKRFRMQWQSVFHEELQYDDETVSKHIAHITIQHGDMVYIPEEMLDEGAKRKLLAYINALFANGKMEIYYEALYKEFADEFAAGRINNIEMLKTYLAYINDGQMHLRRNCIVADSSVEVNIANEVRNFMILRGTVVQIDDIVSALSHIARDKIIGIISGSNSEEFVRNRKGEYFHADVIDFTQHEMDQIIEWIEFAIADKEYMPGKELTDNIKNKLTSIVERYPYLTSLGLRDVLAYKLRDVFSFKGKIISAYGEDLSVSDVFANFAKAHDHFTLAQLNIIKNDLDTPIYFDSVYANSLRINKDDFVSLEQAKFDIDAIDAAISCFCPGDFISVRDVTLFGGFPDVCFPWNHFLLQHYVANYSREYELMHVGFNAGHPAGAIVKRNSQIDIFDDVIVKVLADSNTPLNTDAALQYLCDAGYIARRSYGNLDVVLAKANSYRINKGE